MTWKELLSHPWHNRHKPKSSNLYVLNQKLKAKGTLNKWKISWPLRCQKRLLNQMVLPGISGIENLTSRVLSVQSRRHIDGELVVAKTAERSVCKVKNNQAFKGISNQKNAFASMRSCCFQYLKKFLKRRRSFRCRIRVKQITPVALALNPTVPLLPLNTPKILRLQQLGC